MAHTHDHEIVSIYPFTDAEVDQLLTHANECVLMWATQDGWPVNVSSASYAPDAPSDLPTGAITVKGTGEFFDDDETKKWYYAALAKKVSPNSEKGEAAFNSLLDSPLRVILAVTPVKKIMYNSKKAGAHMAGTISEEELGERLAVDRDRMNEERAKRGLPPR